MSIHAPLRVMYLRPVGNDTFNRLFADTLAAVRLPWTELHVASLNPDDGAFAHIEFRAYQAFVMAGIVRAARWAGRNGIDALAVGCFYDTGLAEAREVSGEAHVTAPCVASLEIASGLANRFGIIIGRQKWADQMAATVASHGMASRLSGLYPTGLGVNDFQADREETAGRIVAAGREAVDGDHAEALILGCTLELGFHDRLSRILGVPVIDPAVAAFKRAEYAALLKRQAGLVPSRKWSCEAPPEAEIRDLGIFDGCDVFGSRVVLEAS